MLGSSYKHDACIVPVPLSFIQTDGCMFLPYFKHPPPSTLPLSGYKCHDYDCVNVLIIGGRQIGFVNNMVDAIKVGLI